MKSARWRTVGRISPSISVVPGRGCWARATLSAQDALDFPPGSVGDRLLLFRDYDVRLLLVELGFAVGWITLRAERRPGPGRIPGPFQRRQGSDFRFLWARNQQSLCGRLGAWRV